MWNTRWLLEDIIPEINVFCAAHLFLYYHTSNVIVIYILSDIDWEISLLTAYISWRINKLTLPIMMLGRKVLALLMEWIVHRHNDVCSVEIFNCDKWHRFFWNDITWQSLHDRIMISYSHSLYVVCSLDATLLITKTKPVCYTAPPDLKDQLIMRKTQ